MALTIGFAIDNIFNGRDNVSESEWWPTLVRNYWGATFHPYNSYNRTENGISTPSSGMAGITNSLYKTTFAGSAYTNLAQKSNKDYYHYDIVCIQYGYADYNPDVHENWGGSSHYTETEITANLKTVVNFWTGLGTYVVLMDYWRTPTINNNDNAWDAAKKIRNLMKKLIDNRSFNNPDMVSMTNLWEEATLSATGSHFDYSGGDSLNKYGNTVVADKVIAGITPHMKKLYEQGIVSSPIISYGVIGDSWAANDTAWNVFDHWTRVVAKSVDCHLVSDAGWGGYTSTTIKNNTLRRRRDGSSENVDTMGQLARMQYAKPDFVFMVMGGNDLLVDGASASTVANNARSIIQTLINYGVKKILWSFYSEIKWSDFGGDAARNKFMELNSAYKSVANSFSGTVVYSDAGLSNSYCNYSQHPESFYCPQDGTTDSLHLRGTNGSGLRALASGLTSAFSSTAAAYKASLAVTTGPYLKIGSSSSYKARLVSNASKPRICIGTQSVSSTASKLIH